MSVIEDDRDIDVELAPEMPSRLARLRYWARTHLILPALLYFALMVSIWHVATHSEAWVSAGSVNGINETEADAVALSSDGERLAVLTRGGEVSLWDTGSGGGLWTVEEKPSGTPLSVEQSDYNFVLGIIRGPLHVLIEDRRSGDRGVCLNMIGKGTRHLWPRDSIVFSPDGRWLAVGRPDGAVSIRDSASGDLVSRIEGHAWTLGEICFSPDGDTLATTSFNRETALWNVRTGECRSRIRGYDGPVFSACFSPDGHTLVTGGHDGRLRFISVVDGKTLRTIDAHDGPVFTIAFSHDGRRIASASDDQGPKALQIRDAASVEVLGSRDLDLVPLHTAFTADGRSLSVMFALWMGMEMEMPLFMLDVDDLRDSVMVNGGRRRSAISPEGQTSVSLLTTGRTTIRRRRRPERWWGIFWLPSLWAAVAIAEAFAVALALDLRYVRRMKRGRWPRPWTRHATSAAPSPRPRRRSAGRRRRACRSGGRPARPRPRPPSYACAWARGASPRRSP